MRGHFNFLILGTLMTISAFSQVDHWEKFNASLLIEVTRPTGVFTCTGVAVSNKIILTAAHCLAGKVKGVRVFIQDHYDPNSSSLEIKSYELHPLYQPNSSLYQADIAKISLKDPLSDDIQIYPIHTSRNIFGKLLRLGFGLREGQNIRTLITPALRRINPEENVLELFDEYSRSGDSGGPIFLEEGERLSLLAIHSTFSHGPEGNYSLNPLLSSYLSWVFF